LVRRWFLKVIDIQKVKVKGKMKEINEFRIIGRRVNKNGGIYYGLELSDSLAMRKECPQVRACGYFTSITNADVT
jgi:hypothetical protein